MSCLLTNIINVRTEIVNTHREHGHVRTSNQSSLTNERVETKENTFGFQKKKHLYSIFYVFFFFVLYLGIDENTLTFTVGMAIHTHI